MYSDAWGLVPISKVLLYHLVTVYTVDSRYSRLPEVRPSQYTGHLAWHGMLAICLLHKTHPEVLVERRRPP